MAFRTNDSKVRSVVEIDTTVSLTNHIRTANTLTNWLVSQDTDGLLTTGLLLEIETYLAAHFYCVLDPQYSSKTTDGAGGSFHGQAGTHFSSSIPGQQALLMDVTGNLARREKETRQGYKDAIQFEFVGMTASESDAYYGIYE